MVVNSWSPRTAQTPWRLKVQANDLRSVGFLPAVQPTRIRKASHFVRLGQFCPEPIALFPEILDVVAECSHEQVHLRNARNGALANQSNLGRNLTTFPGRDVYHR